MPTLALLVTALTGGVAFTQDPLSLQARGAVLRWVVPLASAGDDWINDIVPLRDGSVLAVGFLNRVDSGPPSDWEALAARLTREGRVTSQHTYGKGGGIDAFWTAHERSDGRLVFAGFSSRVGPPGINAYLLATAADGTILKENGYGTPGYDRITSLAPSGTGYIGAGHVEGRDGRDPFILATDSLGVELWRRVDTLPASNGWLYVTPAADGFIVVGGTEVSGDPDVVVEKIDARGRTMWRQVIGARGTPDVNHGVAVLSDGRIVVAGYTKSWGAGDYDIFVATLDASGRQQGIQTFGSSRDDRAGIVKADEDGTVWITGYTQGTGREDWDAILIRMDRTGQLGDGAVLLGGPHDDWGMALLPGRRDVLVGGYTYRRKGGDADAFVARLEVGDLPRQPGFSRQSIRP